MISLSRPAFIAKTFLPAIIFSFFIPPKVKAQSPQLWHEANPSLVLNDATRYSTPTAFRTVELSIGDMRQLLSSAPKENSESQTRSDVIISIPMPDGTLSDFRIWETAVMAPGLQEHFPNIRTYVAEGVTDPRAVARFDVTYFGFHAMVLSPRGNVFIDPVSNQDDHHYISYYKRDLPKQHDFMCEVKDDEATDKFPLYKNEHSGTANRFSGSELRTYRLALACTGEYAATKGGTKSGALSGMVTSINRVDGIYEQEFAIRMQLVPNDTLLIFLNSSTDGYSNNSGGTMLDQNQSKCNSVIGSSNYDIGHVFSTGGGGIANLACVCRNSTKGQGVTGSYNPVGDAFDVDYVAHEMGHQFGANHSFNSSTGSCSGNRWGATAFEPGSGSTIMSYAGICDANDLQSHSDPFFHSGSFDEIIDYTTLDIGNNCPVITNTGNNPPDVEAGHNYSIPISTPFRLDGSATDADGDSLAYMWDEMDHGPSCDWDNPSGQAPLFRSWDEDTFGYRYFPKLTTVINNYATIFIGEVLPDYARTINFRFIARDHHLGGGGVTYNDTQWKLTVVNTSTPFKVTFPNTAITWAINTEWAVTWDVSSTNLSPISCQNVNVLLSIDGGHTYPIIMASNVPNTGVASVTMPNDVSLIGNNFARVMVQSVGNVFYDISNYNFKITDNVGISNVADISSQVNVYPNPVNDELNVAVNGLSNESLTVQVCDVVGRILNETKASHSVGEKKINFDMRKEAGGIYFVLVKTDHGSSTMKVVKQ